MSGVLHSMFLLKRQAYSVSFDGTGDYLSVPSSTQWQFGTGAFCIEFWVYPREWTANATYAPLIRTQGGARGFLVANDSNQLLYHIPNFGNVLTTTLPPVGVWSHVALCRNSSTVSMFVNGARVATATNSTDMQTSSLHIGGGTDWNTYNNVDISNMRIVKGNSVYDPTQTTLTVPSSPLTAISNTSLLVCHASTIIDGSSNNFTVTRFDNAQVSTSNPF